MNGGCEPVAASVIKKIENPSHILTLPFQPVPISCKRWGEGCTNPGGTSTNQVSKTSN